MRVPVTLAREWTRLGDFVADDGSTRAVSLVRLGLPLIVWTEWADQFLLFRDFRPVVALIGLSTLLSTTLLFAGWFSRIAALWTAVSIGAVLGVLGHSLGGDFLHHHTQMLMITAGLLALTPCGGSYSVDRWLALRRAARAGLSVPEERGPLWAQRLLGVHVSTIYLWSAYQKCSLAFLSGRSLQHLYLYYYGGAELPSWPFPIATALAAWITVALEVFLGVGLWFARTRPAAIVAGIVFHLALFYTLPVATFSVQMILLYLVFLDPARLHAFIDAMQAINTKGPYFEGPSGRRGEI